MPGLFLHFLSSLIYNSSSISSTTSSTFSFLDVDILSKSFTWFFVSSYLFSKSLSSDSNARVFERSFNCLTLCFSFIPFISSFLFLATFDLTLSVMNISNSLLCTTFQSSSRLGRRYFFPVPFFS